MLALESICLLEVAQIASGVAKGNLPLGIAIHSIRCITMALTMPLLPTALVTKLVVVAYALTEICRYPAYLMPASKVARYLRYLAPVLTFPLGAVPRYHHALSISSYHKHIRCP